ncbi:MAG: hypothetical protein JWO06_481 [Bacteroidota bacterium]|nr:hypothetical protein [Bacteroidota bacterium]
MNDKVKELELQIASMPDSNRKVELMNDLSFQFMDRDPSKALNNLNLTFELAKKLDFKEGEIICLMYKGLVFNSSKMYTEAIRFLNEAMQLAESTNNQMQVVRCKANMGDIYFCLKQYDNAISITREALAFFEERGAEDDIMVCKMNIAASYGEMKKTDEALKFLYEEADRQEAKTEKNKWALCNIYNNIGANIEHEGKLDEARAMFEKAHTLAQELNHIYLLQMTSHNIGSTCLLQNKADEAIKWFNQSITVNEEHGIREHIAENYEALSRAYEMKEDTIEALKYYKLFKKATDESNMVEATSEIAKLEFQKEIILKEKEAALEREKNAALKIAHDRADALLMNILPAQVAEELKEKGSAEARYFENVTVLFTDFKNFTTVSEKLSPRQLVDELHQCFKVFDEIISKYNIEKIKTIGDAYMAASGLPSANPNHATDLVKAALEIRDFILARQVQSKKTGLPSFEMRIGLNSGPLVAGIVGVTKFAYDIWGDTVNTAARMEQNCEVGKVNIGEATYQLVKDTFKCEYRGEIEAKNKGKLKMYFVE